jgi:hypothetical protein
MKAILISYVFVFMFASSCFAESIAIQLQENDKFVDIVGKAFVTDSSIEIVEFAKIAGVADVISPYAFIYQIIDKANIGENIYQIKCQNQLGQIFSGTLNLKDVSSPKILLKSDRGIVIENIGSEGKQMQQKFLKYVELGK